MTADVQSRHPANASPALRASVCEQIVAARGEDAQPPPPSLLEIAVERVALPDGPLLVARPADWPRLREEEAEAGRPAPYWAVPWPSGLVLARLVASEPPRGLRVLELGCGLALPSAAAARGGAAQVLATDASSDAAVFAAHTLVLNGLAGDTAIGHWRETAPVLAAEPWDLVLAADILYLRENAAALVDLLPKLLAPEGEVWITDPRRAGSAEFLPIAKRLWRLDSRADDVDERVMVHRLRPRG